MSFHTAPQPPAAFRPVDARRVVVRHRPADQVWVARAPDAVTVVGATCDQSPLLAWWPAVRQRMRQAVRPTAAAVSPAPAAAPVPAARATRAVERRDPVEACLP